MTTTAAQQADALVADIERQLQAQRRTLLDAARAEADEIRERARAKAARQLRRAAEDLRREARVQTLHQRAGLETQARQRTTARAVAALDAARPLLAAALEERWHEPAARARWIAAQLGQARARLGAAPWVLRHPADWHADDLAALHATLARQGLADLHLQAAAGLAAGLVIEADGARLDSRPQALCADRAAVDATLLAALEADLPSGRADG